MWLLGGESVVCRVFCGIGICAQTEAARSCQRFVVLVAFLRNADFDGTCGGTVIYGGVDVSILLLLFLWMCLWFGVAGGGSSPWFLCVVV